MASVKTKTFAAEWVAATNSGRAYILLPPIRPTMLMTTDTAKRATKCRGCKLLISKGEERAVVMVRMPTGMAMPNGGTAYGWKFYYHKKCFHGATVGVRANQVSQRRCYSCGRFCTGQLKLFTGSAGTMLGYLCSNCMKKKKQFATCSNCGELYRKTEMSPVQHETTVAWRDTLRAGAPVCNSCSKNWGIVRLKEQMKIDAEEKKLRDKVLEMQEFFLRGGFGE